MSAADVTKIGTEFGDQIFKARKRLKMSQEELSLAVGISRTAITNLESGRFQVSSETLFEIANLLEISLDALKPFFDSGERKKKRLIQFYKNKVAQLESEEAR